MPSAFGRFKREVRQPVRLQNAFGGKTGKVHPDLENLHGRRFNLKSENVSDLNKIEKRNLCWMPENSGQCCDLIYFTAVHLTRILRNLRSPPTAEFLLPTVAK